MARINLLTDEQLPPAQREQARQIEAAGGDATVLRAIAHRQEMFDSYFPFYYGTHTAGIIDPALKELVRLKIARLNECFT